MNLFKLEFKSYSQTCYAYVVATDTIKAENSLKERWAKLYKNGIGNDFNLISIEIMATTDDTYKPYGLLVLESKAV